MNLQQLLFSPAGRIRRLHFWLAGLGVGVVAGVVISIVGMIFGGAAMMMGGGNSGAGNAGAGAMGLIGLLIVVVLYAAVIWIAINLQIKRWHDRGKPAIWVLMSFVPLLNIWAFIETGFLDGTQGPNEYGPSPKGIEGPAPAAAATA